MIKLNKKSDFGKLAKECTTDKQKIDFLDRHLDDLFPEAACGDFSLKKSASKDIDDAFHVYANMKRMTESELDELWKLSWKNYPINFKIFLFDYCYLN